MQRTIQITKDGSATIAIPDMNVTYHGIHGAIQESQHVFIDAGLKHLLSTSDHPCINIFEMGFGTGLNALLSLIEAITLNQLVYYYSIDAHPLENEIASQLNYAELIDASLANDFKKLIETGWEKDAAIHSFFTLYKSKVSLINFKTDKKFHLIYFDAFAPTAQPELWNEAIFKKMYDLLLPEGVLVTYCSKGDVRRAMIAAGFAVEKLQGPPGKREMLRARRLKE